MENIIARTLKDCSKEEFVILVAIAELARQLPYELVAYTRAFGELTRRYFTGSATPQRLHQSLNPSPGSVAVTHKVTVTKSA